MHLNDISYENYKDIIQNALDNNVNKMVVIGFDLESSIKAVKIAKEYSFIYAAIGIHPSEANKEYEKDLVELENLICEKVVAIGEIGLDYHYDGVIKDNQSDLFIKQLKIAKKAIRQQKCANVLPFSLHIPSISKAEIDVLKVKCTTVKRILQSIKILL